jgi:hypothetical protein
VSRDYPDINFLGVAGLDRTSAYEDFVDSYDLEGFPHAIDERRSLFGHFGSATQDAWFFILADGTVQAETRYGEMSDEALRGYLDALDAA